MVDAPESDDARLYDAVGRYAGGAGLTEGVPYTKVRNNRSQSIKGIHAMNEVHISVPQVNREFFRGYAFTHQPQCPSWMDWCGGGPMDNGAVR